MPQANIPSEEEVLSYFDKFSNWGRWGDDDELGAPNLITPAKVKQAIAPLQEGVRISMARTISFEPTLTPPIRRCTSWSRVVRVGPAARRSATALSPLLPTTLE